MNVLKALLRSRKVWLAIIGVVQTIVFTLLPDFDPAVWQAINVLLLAVIAGIAVEDAAEKVGKNNVRILPAALEGDVLSMKSKSALEDELALMKEAASMKGWVQDTPPPPSVRAWEPPPARTVEGYEPHHRHEGPTESSATLTPPPE